MDNSIHGDGHREKHWAGEYFGQDGALQIAREELELVEATPPEEGALKVVLRARMRLMSTVYSAFGHAASQVVTRKMNNKPWYLCQCFKLIFELKELVSITEGGAVEMSPGERDVLIASLLLTSWVSGFWYRERAAELVQFQVASLPFYHVSSLFAKARGYRMKRYFSDGQLNDLHEHVSFAIVYHAPDGKDPKLSWSDVARLARLIGDKERQQYAAKMDGSPDAKLKAGVQ